MPLHMHRALMTITTQKQIASKLDHWVFERYRDFELQTTHDWHGIRAKEDVPQDYWVRTTLNRYESYADELVTTTVSMVLDMAKSPESFVVLSGCVEMFLEYCESDLNAINDRAIADESEPFFSAADLAGIRRRVERAVDSHRGRFNDGVHAEVVNQNAKTSRLGRKPKYNWAEVTSMVWGKIHRGDLPVRKQKDIEDALMGLLADGVDIPNPETVRPYARIIMREYEYDPMDEK